MDKSEWIGRVGDVWAAEWRRTDRTFEPVDAALLATVADRMGRRPSPHVLDVGCGAGTTSLSLLGLLPDASITGIDLSQALLAVARSRAAGDDRLRFEQADAGLWAGAEGFDLIISRHGVMFFADPVATFTHLRRLVRPGASLVFSCFRALAENVWASGVAALFSGESEDSVSDPHAPGPFAFAQERRVADILDRAGWRDARAHPLDYAYAAGEGDDPVGDAIALFRRIGPAARAIRTLDDTGRAGFLERLAGFARAHRDGDRVVFPAAAWIWTATA